MTTRRQTRRLSAFLGLQGGIVRLLDDAGEPLTLSQIENSLHTRACQSLDVQMAIRALQGRKIVVEMPGGRFRLFID